MTTQMKAVRDAIIGGVVTLIGSLALMAATGAWSGKENASDHRNDMLTVDAKIQRVLDVVCIDKATARQCQPDPLR